ncbi:transposase-like protein, IS1381 ISSpn7 [Streptococcus pneumoniae]|nr:transposase-like protein, IS1381 ISSpn7 [Streptococcus pneumoniae]
MATLQYVREYRTYEEIASDLGIHESNLIRRSQWVEVTLVQSVLRFQELLSVLRTR